MHFDQQQILTVSKELWSSQLGLNVMPLDASSDMADERTWSSCVKISGPWQGAVMLECPESIVRHAAVMLFAADAQDPPDDEIEDAVKELAEMFGKRLRSFLPEETKISRPSIVEDQDTCKALSGMQGLSELKLSCEGRPVRVVLFEAEPDLAATG